MNLRDSVGSRGLEDTPPPAPFNLSPATVGKRQKMEAWVDRKEYKKIPLKDKEDA